MQMAFLDIPKAGPPPFEIGIFGASFEPSKISGANLVSSDEKLISELLGVLDAQLLRLLECRTVPEFINVREEVWPRYIRASRALSDTMSNLLAGRQLPHEALDAVFMADLEKQRGARFSPALIDQAAFTVWTLEKMRLISGKILTAGEPRDIAADLKLNAEFNLNFSWCQFHLDCVAAAMRFRKIVPASIQEAICDGLRAAVNAYAIMKEALVLRLPLVEEKAEQGMIWDEEDEILLASSMRDLVRESEHS